MKRDLQFKKVLKINADNALKVVSNFNKYADFVPGCTGASLVSRNPPIEIGRLEFNILGKKYFIESRNEILENSINIEQTKGPFDSFVHGSYLCTQVGDGCFLVGAGLGHVGHLVAGLDHLVLDPGE